MCVTQKVKMATQKRGILLAVKTLLLSLPYQASEQHMHNSVHVAVYAMHTKCVQQRLCVDIPLMHAH